MSYAIPVTDFILRGTWMSQELCRCLLGTFWIASVDTHSKPGKALGGEFLINSPTKITPMSFYVRVLHFPPVILLYIHYLTNSTHSKPVSENTERPL